MHEWGWAVITNDLLERIGQVALEIEEGCRPPPTADQIHLALSELNRAIRLPPRDAQRAKILNRVAALLRTLD